MSPVHVIVSEQLADEQQYGSAFAGAIDLYRFTSNVEAYERLAAARSPIDVLIVTANQDGAFNLASEELVQQLLAPPLASNPNLAAMRIVVVGTSVPEHPRVRIVGSLDAAARLIAFGDVGSAPQPVAEQPVVAPTPGTPSFGAASPLSLDLSFGAPAEAVPTLDVPQPAMDSGMLGNIISSIWNAPAPSVASTERTAVGSFSQRTPQREPAARPGRQVQAPRGTRRGGPNKGGAQRQLFARVAPPVTRTPSAPIEPHIEHAPGLEPSVPFVVPSRGVYRGVNQQANQVAQHQHQRSVAPQHPQQQHAPAPVATVPQLSRQVEQIVYQHPVPSPPDPLLGWSAPVQQQLAAQQQAAAQQQVAVHQQVPAAHQAAAPQQVTTQHNVPPSQQAIHVDMHAMQQHPNMQAVPVSTHDHSTHVAEIFDAPSNLMQRASAADDVSFG